MFYKRKTSKKKKTEDSITTPLNIYEVNEDQPKTEDEDETSKVTASPELLKAIEDELNKLGLKTETTLSSTGRGLVDKRKSLLLQTNPEEFGRPTVFNAPLKNVAKRMELDYAIFARMQEEAAKLQKERKLLFYIIIKYYLYPHL
ncbi:uncharacterized protein LOC135144885 [Zophobas morio]|uniref:uncharacterized protein LOC135144885 n=1 Tax=Zophobas morio TaxID=2755281 RepID=UPI003083A8D3